MFLCPGLSNIPPSPRVRGKVTRKSIISTIVSCLKSDEIFKSAFPLQYPTSAIRRLLWCHFFYLRPIIHGDGLWVCYFMRLVWKGDELSHALRPQFIVHFSKNQIDRSLPDFLLTRISIEPHNSSDGRLDTLTRLSIVTSFVSQSVVPVETDRDKRFVLTYNCWYFNFMSL